MSPNKSYDAVVLGAGVLGLSSALELAEKGLRVVVVARDLPEDLTSTGFASPWAGANWSSFATSEAERRRDTITFRHFERLSKTMPDLVRPADSAYMWNEEGVYGEQWYQDLTPNYRFLKGDELPRGFKHGIGFHTFTLDAPRYLGYLASQVRSRGIPVIRYRVSSLDEAYSLPGIGAVDLVINATGLGARTLLGVEDSLVHPVRGQTVLVKAPHVRKNINHKDAHERPEEKCYIIPRPGPEGHVILGGVQQAGRWDTQPEPDTARRIIERALKACPELSTDGTVEGVEIVSHNVGLRPSREGGIRLELEERVIGNGTDGRLVPHGATGGRGRQVAVVHAYGIGPAGYQSSKGVGEEVADLAVGYVRRRAAKAKL
ncbi:hypothetical protein EHS25_006600 [Saitozyma podzolica]|uniref:FAD dependent oxidoreductase domain-containing protein n=1 Tax=Saitozyma podzolica TaxID=1890683 RepID=A0A427YS95_9TREE|nr:hypothetical protein EHS25_006600 [Saitozyma podzolica]